MTIDTNALINALVALSCDDYTVTATVRDDTIVASYLCTSANLDEAEDAGTEASRRIAEVLKPSGYTFFDAGGDDPGVYEVWHAPTARTAAEIAIDMALNDIESPDAAPDCAERVAADPNNYSGALSCEWRLADICDSYGCSEAVAARAAELYPAALLRLAREAVEQAVACAEDIIDSGEDA